MARAKILQIIPATGWYAAFKVDVEGTKKHVYEPLACWALTEDDQGVQAVEGIQGFDRMLDFVEDDGGFWSYLPESSIES